MSKYAIYILWIQVCFSKGSRTFNENESCNEIYYMPPFNIGIAVSTEIYRTHVGEERFLMSTYK